jgi:pimeloyl-ACP methyl ester carboxylesterase
MSRRIILLIFLVANFADRSSCAQSGGLIDLPWKTLGGDLLWTDTLVYGPWRIQHNQITDHFRLLDPADLRRSSGTEEECRAALEGLKQTESIPPLDGRAVITLHGLGRSRNHMAELGQRLAKEGGFTWINMGYASTRRSLDDHALALAKVIEGLEGIDEINFVCHSLGNLVVRRYLGEASAENPRWKVDSRIKRMVMLGPPNQGARLAQVVADVLKDSQLARLVTGPSAWQLAREWDHTQRLLATPGSEFGIIAGGLDNEEGMNPLLEGDDDLVVRVQETRLPGAADFRLVRVRHGELVYDAAVLQFVLTFLQHGYFTAADERQPIPAPSAVIVPAALQPPALLPASP